MSDRLRGSLRSPAPVAPNYQVTEGLAGASWRAMGTTIFIALPAAQLTDGAAAVESLFAAWEATLSRFDPKSELSRLNARAGEPMRVSSLLWDVLTTALEAARSARGIYDPTLGQGMLRIGYDRSFTELAGLRLDASAQPPLLGGGWRGIRMDAVRRTVTLPPDVALDFGGIAKGMAVDAACALLRAGGIETALVNAGGDLAVLGMVAPGGWPLAVPGATEEGVITLRGGALATSSIGQRAWQQGEVARHHLLDPRTGEPVANGVWAVTVAAGTCAQAEVAAKVALILGEHAGAAFLERWDIAGQFIMTDGRKVATAGWPSPEVATR